MKRTGHLIEQVAEPENLRLAFWKAARGKHGKREVVRFRGALDANLAGLRAGLLDGSWRFGAYHSFRIWDPKERLIHAASFPERVMHHAIMNACEPVLERTAIHHSYACRRGKGQFAALDQAQRLSRRHRFCLKLDIRKYFDSVDHRILETMLARQFKDRALLTLFHLLLESYATQPGKGLPIGALTSQHLANFYLGPLDRFVTEEIGVGGYVRYMDDFVAWDDARERLRDARIRVEAFLGDKLALAPKGRSPVISTTAGLSFLGYRVFPWGLLLAPRAKRRFIRHVGECRALCSSGAISEGEFQQRLTAVCAVARQARSWHFRRHVLQRFGGVSMGLEPRHPRRELEQLRRELSLRVPEQERSGEPEQQPRVPRGAGPQLSSDGLEPPWN